MLVFNSKVIIGDYQFRGVNDINIKSSLHTLEDTAIIKLPGLKEQLRKSIKIGDPVEIYLGYDDEINLEFTGYIDQISPDTPMELKCEDEMWKLKRIDIPLVAANAINYGIAVLNVRLKEVMTQIKDIIPGELDLFIPDIDIGDFRLETGSVYKFLEKIKSQFSLSIYFRGKNFYIGFPYENLGLDTIVYDLQRNVINSSITDKDVDEIKFRLKLVSLQEPPELISDIIDDIEDIEGIKLPKNLEVNRGDPNDVVVVMHVPRVKSAPFLEILADEIFAKLKYGRYQSSLTTFGEPFVKHSQQAIIIDDNYQVNGKGIREESYFIDEVETTVSKNGGFRRSVTLGRKVGILSDFDPSFDLLG